MFTLAALVLAGGAKEFFENPAYLLGIPLVALGAVGMLILFLVAAAIRPPKAKT